ncbi:DUF6417 family protein [Streptomyces rishiriensis]|uniref:DUF6417 family protein n=1 Tax=Streptomyces rishiriensis TaxID=68264 RepID=UPI0037D81454
MLAVELDMPNRPLYRLWRQAAFEAHKSSEWVANCADRTTVLTTTHTAPPLEHRAFRELAENHYTLFAQVFLDDDQRETAVCDSFDILWLTWNDAIDTRSPHVQRRQCPDRTGARCPTGAGHVDERSRGLGGGTDPAQMTTLRLFVALAGRLRVPPADGLDERVREARREPGASRHVLYLSQDQMESVVYGSWLDKMSGSALEANRVACDYGVANQPAPTTPLPAQPRNAAGGSASA